MPYPTAVRRCWLAVAVMLIPACSAATGGGAAAPIQSTTAPASTTGAPTTTAATTATAATGTNGAVLPIRLLTPGATDPRVTQSDISQTICVSGYTTRVRPPESVTQAIKVRSMAAYGLAGQSLASYELDHLIALELGGAPADPRNLWPEPWERRGGRVARPGTGAETKDKVENAAHAAVCSGRLTLAAAQQGMAADWYRLGRSLNVF
jgi:hypothetical protein